MGVIEETKIIALVILCRAKLRYSWAVDLSLSFHRIVITRFG